MNILNWIVCCCCGIASRSREAIERRKKRRFRRSTSSSCACLKNSCGVSEESLESLELGSKNFRPSEAGSELSSIHRNRLGTRSPGRGGDRLKHQHDPLVIFLVSSRPFPPSMMVGAHPLPGSLKMFAEDVGELGTKPAGSVVHRRSTVRAIYCAHRGGGGRKHVKVNVTELLRKTSLCSKYSPNRTQDAPLQLPSQAICGPCCLLVVLL